MPRRARAARARRRRDATASHETRVQPAAAAGCISGCLGAGAGAGATCAHTVTSSGLAAGRCCDHVHRHMQLLIAASISALVHITIVESLSPEVVAAIWPADPFSPSFSLGNHRAEVDVPAAARSQPAVLVHVVWRRRSQPNATLVIATNPVMEQYANATVLHNVAVLQSTMHEATVVFEPKGASKVHLYYLPYRFSGGSGGYASRFGGAIPADIRPDPAWLSAYNNRSQAGLPWANVSVLAARTQFDAFTPMEQAASPTEVAALLVSEDSPPFVCFAEKRTNSIRMNDALPASWLHRTNRTMVSDTAQPDEFYTFQVGVYAAQAAVTVESYTVSPSSLAPAINCFNLGGTRFNGSNFTQPMHINSSRVGALWFGVDVGAGATASSETASGWLNATVHIALSVGGEKHVTNVSVALAVASDAAPISGKGDFDPWRLSRLRWLDSTEGRDYSVSKGYIPLTVAPGWGPTGGGNREFSDPEVFTVALLGRRITVNRTTGLPTSILVNKKEILAAPMQFVAIDHAGNQIACQGQRGALPTHLGEGTITWDSQCHIGSLLLTVHVTTSYEGFIDVVAKVSNHGSSSVMLQDFRLVVVSPRPFARACFP
eukprot:SAG31_NODE_348_length_17296_cov_5.089482_8_plen_604_part_00